MSKNKQQRITFLLSSLFIISVIGCYISHRQYRKTNAYINDCLHGVQPDVLLTACRKIMSERDAGYISTPPSCNAFEFDIDGSNIHTIAWLPLEIAWLRPRYVAIHENYTIVILHKPLRRTGFIAFTEGSAQFGTRQIRDGLWFWNGHYDSNMKIPMKSRLPVSTDSRAGDETKSRRSEF